jgi:hypothetical protein
MEAASTSETSVNFYQTTQRYNLEDSRIQRHVCTKVWTNIDLLSCYTRKKENIYSIYTLLPYLVKRKRTDALTYLSQRLFSCLYVQHRFFKGRSICKFIVS